MGCTTTTSPASAVEPERPGPPRRDAVTGWRLGPGRLVVRLQHERHPPTFHLGVALDLAHRPECFLDLLENVPAQLQVCHLAALELQGELDLVSFLEELAGVVDL